MTEEEAIAENKYKWRVFFGCLVFLFCLFVFGMDLSIWKGLGATGMSLLIATSMAISSS